MNTVITDNEYTVPRMLNASEVAHILSISKRYAYILMETGVIPTVRIGRSIRVFMADLEAYIDSLPRSGGKDA